MKTDTTTPRSRAEHLVIQELADETLVYDSETHKAHCLNKTAAAVWRSCDGATPVSTLAARLHSELGLPADEGVVWMAINQLDKAGLLETKVAAPAEYARVSRRSALARIGLVGGIAALLPLVTSIVAPTPAAAATQLGPGSPCSIPAQCITNLCMINGKCS